MKKFRFVISILIPLILTVAVFLPQKNSDYQYRAKDETGKWVYGDRLTHKPYNDPYARPAKYMITDKGEIRVDRYTISPQAGIYNEKPLYFGDIVKVKNVPWIYNEGIIYYAVVGNHKYEIQSEPSASMIVFAYSYKENGKRRTSRLGGKLPYRYGSEEHEQNCGGDVVQNGCTANIPYDANVKVLGNIWTNENLLKKLSGGNTQSDFTMDICEYDLDMAGEGF